MSEVGRNQRASCADKYPNEADANAKEEIATASMGFYGWDGYPGDQQRKTRE